MALTDGDIAFIFLAFVTVVGGIFIAYSDGAMGAGESGFISDFSGDTGDGHLYKFNAVYATARTDTTATSVSSGGSTINLGQRFYSGNYYIWRSCVIFDTSGIPDYKNITHAWVEMTVYGDSSTTDFYVVAQNGGEYPSYPIVTTDYDMTFYSGNERFLSTSVISVDKGYTIRLDPTLINKTSYTKILLRSSRDIDGNAPAGDEYMSFYSSDHGSAEYHPKLTVVYAADYCVMATNETDGDDGICYKQDADFNTAWIASSGTAYTAISITVGYNLVTTDHRIDRGFLLMDTADLPDDLNLSRYNATLLVYVSQISNDIDFTVHVQNGQPTYPHIPIIAGDYDKSHYLGGLSGGNLNNTTTLTATNWYPIQFNSSWISLTGKTNLTLRSDLDIYGIDFASDGWLTILGDEYPYQSPRLMLEYDYTPPTPPGPGGPGNATETETSMGVWWDTGCITSAVIIFVVIVVIAMFYNRT